MSRLVLLCLGIVLVDASISSSDLWRRWAAPRNERLNPPQVPVSVGDLQQERSAPKGGVNLNSMPACGSVEEGGNSSPHSHWRKSDALRSL